MSAVDLVLPATAEEVLSFSQRLARRRLPAHQQRPADRRAHRRRDAADLAWLRSVRLVGGAGYNVTIIDLSEGGALVEVDAPLRPGVRLTLELSGGGLAAAVPLEVLRSYVARLQGDSTFYRGACMFAHVIDLPSPATLAPAPAKPFVGATAALRHVLDRCDDTGDRITLARPDVLKVLESIHARGDASGGAVGRATLELLGAVLPALQQGVSQQDAAAALERSFRTLPRDVQADLRDAARTLEALIGRCCPGTAAQPGPERPQQAEGAVDSAMQKNSRFAARAAASKSRSPIPKFSWGRR